MTAEALLVTIFFLMPGLIALAVFEWWVAGRDRAPLELIAIGLGLSLLAAAPVAAIPLTRPLVDYLWDPSSLAPRSLGGLGAQTLIGIAMASAAGAFARKKGRIGPKSFYQRSFDWLWTHHADEHRYLTVRTENELYYGELAFADDPAIGQDLVLRNPGRWDEDYGDFYRSGMKYLLIPGRLILEVCVSVSDPLSASDYPFYPPGSIDETEAIQQAS
jgi:hypothetical protein